MEGAWRLETADDLLPKLEHDFQRMQAAPGDSYAAFDFFVTAEHLPDWTDPPCKHLRKRELLLAVVSHIANSSKHFEADRSRHTSAEKTSAMFGAMFNESYFPKGWFARGWWGGRPGVQLMPAVATALSLPQRVFALELAERVLKFWQDERAKFPTKFR